ncbi:MAG: hypothetical protein IID03_11900, partial [Candidatus Dadabacteria bacterium]|nr:hypothetical protein [Candidatus Dadabacteria bacterium]
TATGTETVSVDGTFDGTGGTWNGATGKLIFILTGSAEFTTGGLTFYDLEINKADSSWVRIWDTSTVSNDLTLTEGRLLTGGSGNIQVEGDLIVVAGFNDSNPGNGLITMKGSTPQQISGTGYIPALAIDSGDTVTFANDISINDDFTYISTKLILGEGSHIAPHVTIAGGSDFTCNVGDFSGIGSGSKLYCDSSDFTTEITSIIPNQFRFPAKAGDIIMKNYTGIGVNSAILPNVIFNEGAVLGSLSLVPADIELKPWTLYAGIPAKPIRKRNKKAVMEQVKKVKQYYEKSIKK